MMSNEVGKIKVGKLNKQHEPSSRDAVKVLETVKPRSSLQMQGEKKAHESRLPEDYHAVFLFSYQ